ncbi:MAG: acyltransferase family protein [Phyllobacterium sp.]
MADGYGHSPKRMEYLDALRGWAALWVVVVHIAMLPNPRIPVPDWLDIFVVNGVMGVELFFVVSAFSLCLSMPKHERDPRPILGFAIRRFFRIAPLFYAVAILIAFWNISGVDFNAQSIALNALFLFNFIEGHQISLVPAGWTIGVEMAFYMIFPFLFRRINNVMSALVALGITIAIAKVFYLLIGLITADPGTYFLYSIFYRAPIFMFGFLAFFALPTLEKHPQSKQIGAFLLAWVPVMFFGITSNKMPLFDAYYWQGLMFAMAVVGMALCPLTFVSNRITSLLGEISYSVYLVHTPIIVLLMPQIRAIESAVPSRLIAFLLITGMVIVCVVLTAMITYKLIESPLNNYGRKLAKRVAGRQEIISATG